MKNKTTSFITIIVAPFLLVVGISLGQEVISLQTKIKTLQDSNVGLNQTIDLLVVERLEKDKKVEDIKNQILKLRPKLSVTLVDEYARLINLNCEDTTQKYMVAIFEQESSYNATVRSHDDWGLGQINARTWQSFFNVKNKKELFNPILNIKLSCEILKMAYDTHGHKENWWSWYHSWNSIPRKEYIKRINKVLERLK